MDLDDLAVTRVLALMVAVDDHPVTGTGLRVLFGCFHRDPPPVGGKEQVEVGIHRGLLGDVDGLITADFDLSMLFSLLTSTDPVPPNRSTERESVESLI